MIEEASQYNLVYVPQKYLMSGCGDMAFFTKRFKFSVSSLMGAWHVANSFALEAYK